MALFALSIFKYMYIIYMYVHVYMYAYICVYINMYTYIRYTYISCNIYIDTTSACCGKTVLVARRMDTGVNTAEVGCEEGAAAALQA